MNIDDLSAFGAKTEEGVGRCMGNEDFYLRMVDKMKNDKNFAALKTALAENDLDAAFDAAHNLKGSLGNLAITPLYEPMSEVTELLRSRTDMDYAPLMDNIESKWEEFCAL